MSISRDLTHDGRNRVRHDLSSSSVGGRERKAGLFASLPYRLSHVIPNPPQNRGAFGQVNDEFWKPKPDMFLAIYCNFFAFQSNFMLFSHFFRLGFPNFLANFGVVVIQQFFCDWLAQLNLYRRVFSSFLIVWNKFLHRSFLSVLHDEETIKKFVN